VMSRVLHIEMCAGYLEARVVGPMMIELRRESCIHQGLSGGDSLCGRV